MNSAITALKIYALSVLPALFPFMFFTKILSAVGIGKSITDTLGLPVARLYNVPNISLYILMMSLISGYPVGASIIGDMYDTGLISQDEAKRICTFTSIQGPIFVVGTIGTAMLNNSKAGYIIYLSVTIGALVNGLLYRGKKQSKTTSNKKFSPLNVDFAINDAMLTAVKNILLVGGYIIIFYIISDILCDTGIIKLCSKCLEVLTYPLGIDSNILEGMCLSFIEMTRGIPDIANSSQLTAIIPAISGIVAFGGMSIMLQSMSFLKSAKVKVSYYLLSKLTHAILSIFIAIILTHIIA